MKLNSLLQLHETANEKENLFSWSLSIRKMINQPNSTFSKVNPWLLFIIRTVVAYLCYWIMNNLWRLHLKRGLLELVHFSSLIGFLVGLPSEVWALIPWYMVYTNYVPISEPGAKFIDDNGCRCRGSQFHCAQCSVTGTFQNWIAAIALCNTISLAFLLYFRRTGNLKKEWFARFTLFFIFSFFLGKYFPLVHSTRFDEDMCRDDDCAALGIIPGMLLFITLRTNLPLIFEIMRQEAADAEKLKKGAKHDDEGGRNVRNDGEKDGGEKHQ